MIPKTLEVYSSNGRLRVDTKTGKVLAIKEYGKKSYISTITRFETGEWLRHLAKNQMQQSRFARCGNEVDILDLSFWAKDGSFERHCRERYADIEKLQSKSHA